MAFAKYGITRLALADVNAKSLETARDELRSVFPGVQVLKLDLDVRDGRQVSGGIRRAAAEFGRLDVAVNNAGVGGSGLLTHLTPDEEIEQVLDVNLQGVYRCQKAQLGVMVEQEYVYSFFDK